MMSMFTMAAVLSLEDTTGGLGETMARLLESQPLAAAVISALILGLALLLLRKVFNVALLVIALVAVIGGALVYVVGPEQAKDYLEELQQHGQRLLEEADR